MLTANAKGYDKWQGIGLKTGISYNISHFSFMKKKKMRTSCCWKDMFT